MPRPEDFDFPCSQTWRDFYSQPHKIETTRRIDAPPSVEMVCNCENCYYTQEFGHCSCREPDVIEPGCPDWIPRSQ